MKQPASRYINQIVSLREQKVSWADIVKKLRMSAHRDFKVQTLQMAFYNHRNKLGKKVKITKASKATKPVQSKESTTDLIKKLLKVETEAQGILQELRSRLP